MAHGAAARLKISSTPDEGCFPPGTLLGQRYRISNRLGKGGMGEVYKAADLLLGQTVALKFLPESLLSDERMLERFRGEVRLARQVSHPNVCRVYDLGEADGQPFLSMEFIDGEDLASLLRRIGHLPGAKSLEIARKLCAGLAAAHEKGVVHRDFKPANIMIDSRGKVLITDFGLAVATGGKYVADPRSGTPAYMSPEQLAGAAVTARSDLYALGLVLYEMFVGQHPYGSGLREARPPAMRDVDPAVEAVVLRCLNADPGARPATALAVAASLPGGDPVAAALAAGETPTPKMVAGSGSTEAMNPKIAHACFAGLLIGIIVLAWGCGKGWPFAGVVEKSPEAMSDRAREVLAQLGYPEKPADSEGWYECDYDALGSLGQSACGRGQATDRRQDAGRQRRKAS
jgi:serine/threonine protein kinase